MHQRNQIGTSLLLIAPAGSCAIGLAWRGATAWVQSHFKSRATRSQYYESLSYNFEASARESSPHLPSVRRGCDRRVLLYVQSGQFHSLGHLSPTSFTSRPCQRSGPSPRYHQAALDPLLPTIRRPPWRNRIQPRTIDRTFFSFAAKLPFQCFPFHLRNSLETSGFPRHGSLPEGITCGH